MCPVQGTREEKPLRGLPWTAFRKGLWKLFARMPPLKPQECTGDCGLGQFGKVFGEKKGLLVAAWGSVPQQARLGQAAHASLWALGKVQLFPPLSR